MRTPNPHPSPLGRGGPHASTARPPGGSLRPRRGAPALQAANPGTPPTLHSGRDPPTTAASPRANASPGSAAALTPSPAAPAQRHPHNAHAPPPQVPAPGQQPGAPTRPAKPPPSGAHPGTSLVDNAAPPAGRASPAMAPSGWPLHALMRLARSPVPHRSRSPSRVDTATISLQPSHLPQVREEALLASIANLRTQVQHRLHQVQTIRSDTRSTIDRLQRAQRTFDALIAAPLRFHSSAVGPLPGGPTGSPSVRSPSPRPRNSR